MTAEIHLQFIDPTLDRTETVEVYSITELENYAWDLLRHEGANNVNFWLTSLAADFAESSNLEEG